ncbi:MAG TPA: PSD1 and planctomycete cytochrome C domain-containing protein, partial [Blastocatellia bacterium]|nr:PSD1 and planctomycete cytochrome C domain-containing protein [Blastocatellia bacterium]
MVQRLKYAVCLALLSFSISALSFNRESVQAISGKAPVDFRRDIQPILEAACNRCHGAKRAAGQLRLDVKRLAMKGGISGAVIMPGESGRSRLLQRILGEGGEQRMPLGGDPLRPGQIELIRQWIDEGAKWPDDGPEPGPVAAREKEAAPPKHWAYVKPVQTAPPAVKNAAWVRNPIDNFVLARLEKEGWQPAPEASRETLARRVYLDLIGLPPSPQELDEFLADTSPGAYERLVDRLLQNPHYGERWARPWLDLARYADSNGYEKDRPRVMWKYRDWVINALNRDLPFDQFTIEQLAGDMLPNPTVDQKIATGFHRNTMLNQEGGVDDEEARWEVLIDRVNTTATVWLGSTIGCAQCHNHKYDPFTQREFYQLMAFFDNHEYKLLELGNSEGWVVEPELELPTPEQVAKRQEIRTESEKIDRLLSTPTPELDAAQAAWEREILAAPETWTALDPVQSGSSGGATLGRLADRSILVSGANPENDEVTVVADSGLTRLTGIRLEALPDQSLPRGGPGRNPYGNFRLSDLQAEVTRDGQVERLTFSQSQADNQVYFRMPPGGGWAIDATRDEVRLPRQAVFALKDLLVSTQPMRITIKLKYANPIGAGIGRFRLSATGGDNPLKIVSVPATLRSVLGVPAEQRKEAQKRDLTAAFRNYTPLLKKERDRQAELRRALENLGIVTAQVMGERPGFSRPCTWFRERGSYLNKGAQVYAATPAILSPMPENAPINRLGLAMWLVDENNPLTARVTVNRLWAQIFGRGLVETQEDFGTQSEAPSHPELLDWLAVEFMKNQKWSMKALHRLIVTSATYRQSSAVTAGSAERDPYNRLLAHGPRFRMEAEMIRDTMLAASGLLSLKLGGPSVMPRQPDGIWDNPYDGDRIKWQLSEGEDRYRRSLYIFLRRTAPYPGLMAFDAVSREVCTVKRVRTNTPLQALALLNDEAVMEMARALSRRV